MSRVFELEDWNSMLKPRFWLSCVGAWWAFCAVFLSAPSHAFGAETPPPEKTLSPYFEVEGGDPRVDSLPLLKTRVEVTVSGTIAAVTVRQTYKNDGKRPINARYVFPASTRAAVTRSIAGATFAPVRMSARAREA